MEAITIGCFRRTHDLAEEDLGEVQRENLFAERLTSQINRALLNNIHARYPHLLNCQVRKYNRTLKTFRQTHAKTAYMHFLRFLVVCGFCILCDATSHNGRTP